MRNKNRQRGNAMIEFALSVSILIFLMFGTFQFGYTFYVYDQLQTSVRNGTRFASIEDFNLNAKAGKGNQLPTPDSACEQKMIDNVKNVVVYGTTDPYWNLAKGASPVPVVRGLQTSNVLVDFHKNGYVPTKADITINDFTVDAIFGKVTFNGKPHAELPYQLDHFSVYAPCN